MDVFVCKNGRVRVQTHLPQHMKIHTGYASLFWLWYTWFILLKVCSAYLTLILDVFYPKFSRRLLSISHKEYKNPQFIYFWVYVSGNCAYMLTLTQLCQFPIDMVKGKISVVYKQLNPKLDCWQYLIFLLSFGMTYFSHSTRKRISWISAQLGLCWRP